MRHESPSPSPRISFVVPVYGVERFLGECLESLLAHPGGDIEVVAVDDASPDGCGAILDAFAARDPRVRPVHLTVNVGLGGARNAGLAQAKGDYVWYIDSDDWIPDGAVRAVLDRLALHQPDVLIVDHAEVFGDGSVVPRVSAGLLGDAPTPLHLSRRPELLRLAQSACTKIARRSFLEENDLRFHAGWYEDAAYSHPLLMTADSIDVLDLVCYKYRQQTPGAITASVSTRHFEVFEQYDRVFAAVEKAGGKLETFRPELFRLMINHYLVIIGHDRRLGQSMRKAFFRRIAEDYRRRLPEGGYLPPGGLGGLKHRLVRYNAYGAYTLLRVAHRLTSQRLAALRGSRQAAPALRLPVPTSGVAAVPRQRAETDAAVLDPTP
ncbi:glycosyltransferase family 2 protein [Catellatospora methionotrophica]|uniref:glycosyltransferase family 2 protein n=1 Tax=Catellatospora methionotrophica TaxID=121620 RepID=UPI0014072CE7|nr:glycosyltransferase family 2 protein [Catellatospora methionotrophica]